MRRRQATLARKCVAPGFAMIDHRPAQGSQLVEERVFDVEVFGYDPV
ncbi:MAG: hypothetical protein U9R25_20630 [Chloroflexota bacterium]|nr:hypothetical protein [Chloroflexota bacterium]